jgi:hypothetical protein
VPLHVMQSYSSSVQSLEKLDSLHPLLAIPMSNHNLAKEKKIAGVG